MDFLLLLMAIIWGTNYSIVKFAFHEVDPQAFNAVRMSIASAVFLTIIGVLRLTRPSASAAATSARDVESIFRTPTRLTARDGIELVALGLVGHFLYQYFFIGGLALTSVANSSLMLAATPVVIALISAVFGQERVGARHWAGAALSRRHLHRRGQQRRPRRTWLDRRPHDGGGSTLLGAVYARLAPPHLAPFSRRRDRALDGHWHAGLRPRDVVARAKRGLERPDVADVDLDRATRRFSRSVSHTRFGMPPSARSGAPGRRSTRTSSRLSPWPPPSSFSASLSFFRTSSAQARFSSESH